MIAGGKIKMTLTINDNRLNEKKIFRIKSEYLKLKNFTKREVGGAEIIALKKLCIYFRFNFIFARFNRSTSK